jgi:hypothetical protein
MDRYKTEHLLIFDPRYYLNFQDALFDVQTYIKGFENYPVVRKYLFS